MKLLSQKGLSLVEIMVSVVISAIVIIGVMTYMENQIKTHSHLSQKSSADEFVNELKELLSSKEACIQSLGAFDLSAKQEIKEIRDEKGNILYRSSSSEETKGKNKIDDLVKIKTIELEKDETEAYLKLNISLEKINKSMANQVFKKTIDAIKFRKQPIKFTITADAIYGNGAYLGYMRESFAGYDKKDSSQSGAPPGLVGISNGKGISGSLYVYADEPLYSQIKKLKIKEVNGDLEETYTFSGGDEYGEKTYKGGVPNKGLAFTKGETYEVEFLNDDDENQEVTICQYGGLRGVSSLEEDDLEYVSDNENDEEDLEPVPEINRESIKFSITTKKISSSSTRMGYMKENLGGLWNEGSSTTANIPDFLGMYTDYTNIYFYAEAPLIDEVKKIKATKPDGSTKIYNLQTTKSTYYAKTYKRGMVGVSYFDEDTTYEIELISDDDGFSEKYFSVKLTDPSQFRKSCLAKESYEISVCDNRTKQMSVLALKHGETQNVFEKIGNCICSGYFKCDGSYLDPNDTTKGLVKNHINCVDQYLEDHVKRSALGFKSSGCTAQTKNYGNCSYDIFETVTSTPKTVYDISGKYKGSASVKCENNQIVFDDAKTKCDTYHCLYPVSSSKIRKKIQEQSGSSLGVPGQNLKFNETLRTHCSDFQYPSHQGHDGYQFYEYYKSGWASSVYNVDLTCTKDSEEDSGGKWTGTKDISALNKSGCVK